MKQKTALKLLVSVLSLLSLTYSCNNRQPDVKYNTDSVIPKPDVLMAGEGFFIIDGSVRLTSDTCFKNIDETLDLFNSFLRQNYKHICIKKRTGDNTDAAFITVSKDNGCPAEGYTLDISTKGITIGASDDNGVFFAFQTLMQLIYPSCKEINRHLSVPCVKIEDAPQFKWRGLHLDVSRHFFSKEFIFKLLDVMAMHKLNTFHWHLTDDQGWRIEIKKYPELTRTGAYRDETLIGHGSETPWIYDGIKYGGYYTQEDIKEVVRYAKKLRINIVPEIEMPGHAVAALRSYPEYSCTPQVIPEYNRWGVSDDLFCAGNEATYTFLTDILSEVIELFPYEYIHIGGDECPKEKWKKCPLCQKKISDEHLKDEDDLQGYFVKRINAFLKAKGKKVIVWDEINEGNLPESAAIMSWRGFSAGINAAGLGHDVIMTPYQFVYFDYYQSGYNEPMAIGEVLDLKKVYSFRVIPDELAPELRSHVLGAQANVWTEYMNDDAKVEFMIFPRLAALSEVLWSDPRKLSYDDFVNRMNEEYARYDSKEINYRVQYPSGFRELNLTTSDTFRVELANGIKTSEIHYTLDGSEPGIHSPLSSSAVILRPDTVSVLKAVTIMPSGKKSYIMTGLFRKTRLKESSEPDSTNNGLTCRLFKGDFRSTEGFPAKADTIFTAVSISIPVFAPENFFGLEFDGFVKVPQDGIYSFYTVSDDGVLIKIDGETILDGNKNHHGIVNEGKCALKSGMHHLTLRYFQTSYRKNLVTYFSGPGIEKCIIPSDILFTGR